MRILGYLIMPNHWHLVLWPEHDGDLGAFMQRLTTTHVRRWHLHRNSVGYGHLYQGTYKSFPIETDEHLLTVLCYVERNALRAGLVERAEDWRWSSLWRWRHTEVTQDVPPLTGWPVERPRQWLLQVNRPQPKGELEAVQTSSQRGRPFGSAAWQALTAEKLGLESTFHARGRPRKRK
jgi:putative transposase